MREASLLAVAPDDIASQLHQVRRRFLESATAVLLVLAGIGLPLSLLRISQTGMHSIHVSHCATAFLIVLVFWARKRLRDHWLLASLLCILTALSISAFLQYGLVSAGFYLAAGCIFIAGLTLGVWGGVVCAAAYAVLVTCIAWLWISGYLVFPGEVRQYIALPSVWALLAVTFIVMTALFFISAAGLIASLRDLLGTVHRQKEEIESQHTALTLTNRELAAALAEVKTLSGLLPICANCKKIRDDDGYWQHVEHYVQHHSEAKFSHSICPQCTRDLYPEIVDDLPDSG